MSEQTFQIGIFNHGSESWNWYRSDWPEHRIIAFPTREEAVLRAVELSKTHQGHEVIVVTLYACFSTDTEYPKVEPIHRTREITIEFSEAR
jgi:hypothetical protein